MVKKINEECGEEEDIIIYFYSNLGDCGTCDLQGNVLTYLLNSRNKLSVYAFDVNIDNTALNILKKRFNITTVPTLIVNNEKYEGYIKLRELEKMLG